MAVEVVGLFEGGLGGAGTGSGVAKQGLGKDKVELTKPHACDWEGCDKSKF